jgi:two-component system LytT family response regulator
MRTLNIDDEQPSREALRHYRGKYCPGVTVVGEAECMETALTAIRELKPALLFFKSPRPTHYLCILRLRHLDRTLRS